MTPREKFAEQDERIAALEAAVQALHQQVERLTQAIDNDATISDATIAPTPAKRRGRPPKNA